LTAKKTNYKINKSGVAGIQHFQAKEYSNTLGLRGGGSRYKFTMILKNKIKIYSNFNRNIQLNCLNLIANNSINLTYGNLDINIARSNVSSINSDLKLNSMQVRN
jgi:hypothetical protein